MAPLVFRSKVDKWLVAAIAAAAGLCIVAVAPAALASPSVVWIALPSLLLALGLPLWLLRATDYTLDGDLLLVRSGPFKWRVPLREIRAVTPTRNPLSSPALSLDRLRIDYGGGRSIMVSPRDKERFVAELERRRHGR